MPFSVANCDVNVALNCGTAFADVKYIRGVLVGVTNEFVSWSSGEYYKYEVGFES